MKQNRVVITFGTFDVFHVGHLRILKRAKELGDKLVVGVSSDNLNKEKKGRYPVYSEKERLEIISSLKYVDEAFLEESLEKKPMYLKEYKADVLVMGDDWKGKFDIYSTICKVTYFPRTPSVSTTQLIERIQLDT